MKYYADDLTSNDDVSCGKVKVEENESYFSRNAELFYDSVRQGYFPSFYNTCNKNDAGQVFIKPVAVRYDNGQIVKGMNQLVLQQLSQLLEFPASVNGSVYLSADERALADSRYQVKISTSSNFGKIYNYCLAPVRKNFIEGENIGQKFNFIVPDDFDAAVYLGKWIAASKVGGTFVTTEEKNRRAQRLILMELLKGKEEELAVNAYNLGKEAESESNKILYQAVDKVKSSGIVNGNIRYDEKESCFSLV